MAARQRLAQPVVARLAPPVPRASAAWRDERLPRPAVARARRAAVLKPSAAAVQPTSLRPALHPRLARMPRPSRPPDVFPGAFPGAYPDVFPDVFPRVFPDVFPRLFPPPGRMNSLMFLARARSSLFQSWQAMRLPVRLPRLDSIFGDRQRIPQASGGVRRWPPRDHSCPRLRRQKSHGVFPPHLRPLSWNGSSSRLRQSPAACRESGWP
jgi:hypothetical protein